MVIDVAMLTSDRRRDIGTLPAAKGHPWFAAMYDIVTWWAERHVFGPLRQRIVGAAAGQVLEIGAGTGANFPYYPSAVEAVVATDPDPFMLRRAQQHLVELERELALLQCPAEALPFGDASFDTVVATLVFCTVTDPARAMAEVRRVLKPGGTLRFIEHVRAGGFVGQVQDVLTPLQRRLGAGCHLNRQTAATIEAAGLEIVEIEQRQLLLTPLIIGVAKRSV